jgi:hypothetical protein
LVFCTKKNLAPLVSKINQDYYHEANTSNLAIIDFLCY